MSNLNGRQKKAIEELAAALRPPPVERLAAALNECFDAAVESGESRARQAMREEMAGVKDVLAKQNDTLRMIWKQRGGQADESLPIDD